MLNFFKNASRKAETSMKWQDITVPSPIASKLGFKTTMSGFYVVGDKDGFPMDMAPEAIKRQTKRKPAFRGVFCDAGMEMIEDIKADLQKYCDLMGMSGLTRINGKDIEVIPTAMKINAGKGRE